MRYLLGFLAVIGLVVVVVVLIIRGLSGGDNTTENGVKLTDYTHTDTVMRMTIEGPINSEQVHQSVRVTVGRSESKVEALQGYENAVFDSRSFGSNSEAYGTFLRALDLLDYNRGSDNEALEDARGYCPEGNLYTFEIIDSNSSLQRYWLTSCGEGTFAGQAGKIQKLFKAQIPDYGKFIRNVNL